MAQLRPKIVKLAKVIGGVSGMVVGKGGFISQGVGHGQQPSVAAAAAAEAPAETSAEA